MQTLKGFDSQHICKYNSGCKLGQQVLLFESEIFEMIAKSKGISDQR